MIDAEQTQQADALIRMVTLHDLETAQHLEATAALAKRIALAMSLNVHEVAVIELAARLHDVGKLAVERHILTKTGALTAEEWQSLRQHPEAGAAVLKDIPALAFLAPIVAAHHERPDGFGYPLRMRLADIPLEARVVTVADCFHAMTTKRSYCEAKSPLAALAELEANAGTQFDLDVVHATLRSFSYRRRAAQLRRAMAS